MTTTTRNWRREEDDEDKNDDDNRSDSAAGGEKGVGGFGFGKGVSPFVSKSEDGEEEEEELLLARRNASPSSSSSAAALSQSSLFSEEEGDEIDDGGGNDGGGAPETPNSIDPEWLRQHFYAAARRHRERVLSDEENEYGITNARTRTNRRARRDAFGNVMDDFDDDFDDDDEDRATMNSEDVFSRDNNTNDDYYEEGDSIFSEDSEFLRNAQNAAAHRNRGAGYNPFGMNMNSSASTRNVGRSSSGRDFRRNNNNNNNKIRSSNKDTEIESDTDDDDEDTTTTPLLTKSPTRKGPHASPGRKKADSTNAHRNHQPQVDTFVPVRARDVLEHSADFYDTSVNSGLSPFEVTRRLRKFGPNSVPGEKFDYGQLVKHALREFNAPAGRVIFFAIFLQCLQAMDPAKTLDSIIDVLVLFLVFFANCYVGWSESRDDGALMAGTEVTTSALTTTSTKATTKQSQKQILENMTRTNAPRNGQFPAYATVVRDNGKQMRVSSKSLVPGDIVELRVGQIVPCDCVYRGSGVLFVTRNSNYLINTASSSTLSSSLFASGTPRGGAGRGDELSMLFGDDNEMDSLDLIGVSEGEPVLGGSVIYAGCGAAIVGRTGPRTAIARKMQQIMQIEEHRANAAGILGFFSMTSTSHQNRSRKSSMVRSKSFGALFGSSASTQRRSHHHRQQVPTMARTTVATPPRGSAFDRSLDLVMTGVAVASFASAISLWLFLVVAGRGFWFACSFATVLCVCALPIAVRVVVHATVALGIRRMAKARASPGYSPGLDDYYPEYYLNEQANREHLNMQQRQQSNKEASSSSNPLSSFVGSTTTRTFGISRLSAIQDVAAMQALFCSTSCCVVDRFATRIVGEPIVFADSCQPRDVLVAAALASRWWKNSSSVMESATPTTARSNNNNVFEQHLVADDEMNLIFDDSVDRAIAERLAEDGLSSLSETYIQKTYEPYDSVVKLSRATISREEAMDGSNSGVFAVAKGCLESIDNLVRRETMISRAGNEEHAKKVFKALDEARNRERMFERRGLRCVAVACAYDVQTTAEVFENSAQNQGSIVNGWVFLGIFAFSRHVRQDCNAGRDALKALGVDVKLFTSASESFAKVRTEQLHNPKRVLSSTRTGNAGEEFASSSLLDNQDTDSELNRSENASQKNRQQPPSVSPRVQSFYTNAGKRYEGIVRNCREVLEGRPPPEQVTSEQQRSDFVSDAERGIRSSTIHSTSTTTITTTSIVPISKVDCFFECSNAETKANIIRRFKQAAMHQNSRHNQRFLGSSRKVIVGVLGDRLEDLPAMRASDAAFAASQSSTDAAVRVADFVVSRPSLAHVASAIVEARAVFARAKTYVLYRIICTCHLLTVFVLCAFLVFPNETNVAWPKTFTLPVIALALLASVNDCVVLSIAYDFARPSASPEAWRLPCILASGLAMGFVATFTTCFVAREIFSSSNANFGLLEALDIAPDTYEQAKCMIFLKMALTDAFSVLCARSDGPDPFWTLAPGGFLFLATMASSFASILLTRHWPFHEMSPCTFEQTLFCICVALLSFLLQDAAKTISYRALVRAEWMPERRRLSSAETKRISAVAARDIDLERREALRKAIKAKTSKDNNVATGATFTPRNAPPISPFLKKSTGGSPIRSGQRTPTAANDAAYFNSAQKFNASPHRSPRRLETTMEGEEDEEDEGRKNEDGRLEHHHQQQRGEGEHVNADDDDVAEELSSIDEDEDDHFGARPTSLYDSPAEEPETVLQNKLRAEKGELTIDTFTRLTFGYRTILNKELKQLSLSIDWSRAFRDLRRAKADSQVGALLDAHATLRCLDADCGVGAFSMMLAEKLAAKKLKKKGGMSGGKMMNSDDNDGEEEYELSSSDSENLERETGLSKEEKKKVMTSDEKEDEESALNGRVVAVELLSTSLVCLKHALEEINENDIDSPFRAVALHRGTLDVFKVKPMSYDVAYNAFGFERIQKGTSLRAAARAFAMSVKTNGLGFIAVHAAKSADAQFHALYRNAFVASSTTTMLPSSPTASSASMTTAEDVIDELHRLGVAYNVTTKSYQLRIEKIGEYNRRILESYLHGVAMDDSLTLEEICADAKVAQFLSKNDRGDHFSFTQIVAHVTL